MDNPKGGNILNIFLLSDLSNLVDTIKALRILALQKHKFFGVVSGSLGLGGQC